MVQAQFPEPAKLDILEIGDAGKPAPGAYTLDKPHPGYGKDPNVISPLGTTIYPKMVYPKGVNYRDENGNTLCKVAKDEKHEKQLMEGVEEDNSEWK